MKKIAEVMAGYQIYHTKQITKLTHYFGVSIITFSLLILFSWIKLSVIGHEISFTWLGIILLMAYYLYLDLKLGLLTAVIFIVCAFIAQLIAQHNQNLFGLMIFFALFIIGAALQMIGHQYEGNRPAFLENAYQVFVAPIFIIAEWTFALGYRKELEKDVLQEMEKLKIH